MINRNGACAFAVVGALSLTSADIAWRQHASLLTSMRRLITSRIAVDDSSSGRIRFIFWIIYVGLEITKKNMQRESHAF